MPNQYTIAVYDNIVFLIQLDLQYALYIHIITGGPGGDQRFFLNLINGGSRKKIEKLISVPPPFIRHLRVLIQYIYVISKLNYYIYYIYTNIHNEHLVITRST